MALKTMGTTANNVLDAVDFQKSLSAADVASIANAIKDDLNPAHPIYPGAFALQGFLFVPNRGILKILPGDYVGVDNTGWPILVSANSIGDGSSEWAHS